jgi:hypothetical protein
MKWKESNINTRVHRGFTWLTQYNTFGILKQNEATKRCPNAPQSVNCQGKQHHANQFSQLQIKASELNYASKTFVDCLIKRNKIQKRLSLVSPPKWHRGITTAPGSIQGCVTASRCGAQLAQRHPG